jgi:hypothetical protein
MLLLAAAVLSLPPLLLQALLPAGLHRQQLRCRLACPRSPLLIAAHLHVHWHPQQHLQLLPDFAAPDHHQWLGQ